MIFKRFYVLTFLVLSFFWFVLADALGDVDISFCDNTSVDMSGNIITGNNQSWVIVSGNAMSYKIWVGQEWNICYVISNKSAQDTTFKISFVDGTFTNDQWQNKACLSDTDTKYFGQYVTGYENILTVSWSQIIQKSAKFTYPSGSDGVYHGCLVYSVLDSSAKISWEQTNFAILMRRARFVDVLVWNHMAASENAITLVDFNPLSGENLSSNPKIRIYIDPADGKYVIQFQLKNVSSMDQDVSVTWSISNFIAYNKSFSEPRRLLRWETLLVTRKLDEIPYYNLKTKLDISYVPYYGFDAGETSVWILNESVNMWIFDTVFIVSIVWLLLFLVVFFLLVMVLKNQKKKEKK